MSKTHLSLYAVLFAIVGLFAGWQAGSALAGKHHRQRMDSPTELVKLLAEASTKKQGQVIDSVTRIDRLEAKGDELTYHLTLTQPAEAGSARIKRRARQNFTYRMCTTSETAYLLSKNVKVRVIYKDSAGESLLNLPIAAADCAGLR